MIGVLPFLQIVLCVGGISKAEFGTVVFPVTVSVSTAGCFFLLDQISFELLVVFDFGRSACDSRKDLLFSSFPANSLSQV